LRFSSQKGYEEIDLALLKASGKALGKKEAAGSDAFPFAQRDKRRNRATGVAVLATTVSFVAATTFVVLNYPAVKVQMIRLNCKPVFIPFPLETNS
jgi:hypothetical protein